MQKLHTDVAIVGAGPAGLLLAHLLHSEGIDTVVLDSRERQTIAETHRAGILEAGSVRLLETEGIESRVHTVGHRHDGIDIRINGESTELNFPELIGESVWLYPQNEIFVDLSAARERTGRPTFYSTEAHSIEDVEGDAPRVLARTADGDELEVTARYVIGADGSRSMCRKVIPEDKRERYYHEYPFAWYGILCEAPPSHEVLIYARSERGFALISQRSPEIQRMYLQVPAGTKAEEWSDQEIWDELNARVAGPDGFQLKTGPIIEKTVLPFRSTVTEPMQYGSLYLAGDAAHTVPPTGAKGLNLAFADIAVLAPALTAALKDGDESQLEAYTDAAVRRVWKAQNFSYQMTRMLHSDPESDSFEDKRTLGELRTLLDSENGRRYIAECYTGWPYDTSKS